MTTAFFSRTLLATALFSSLALADTDAKTPKHPIMHLEAQAYTEVKQDTVVITLQATKQSSEQSVVTKELSEIVSGVLSEAKKQDKVKISTGNYYVRPQHDKEGKITAWSGQSQLIFESTDMKAASALAAQFQDKMPIDNVRFTVSKKAQAEAEQDLMKEVAEAFKQRSQAMTVTLGYKNFEIKEIHLGGNGAVYTPRSYNMGALKMASPTAAVADALPIDGGTQDISLSINGAIYLLD